MFTTILITLVVSFLWAAFLGGIVYAYKRMVWDSWIRSRAEKFERARRMSDRRG